MGKRARTVRPANEPVLTPSLIAHWSEHPEDIPARWRAYWDAVVAEHVAAGETIPNDGWWLSEPPEDYDRPEVPQLTALERVSIGLALEESAAAELRDAVAAARLEGHSWASIGAALGGVSRQAAHERFAR
jgi:hypothetical protein